MVFLDRSATNIVADTVLIDNVGGARTAVRHLAKGGHRRIAFVGDPARLATHRQRLSGFHDVMEELGCCRP